MSTYDFNFFSLYIYNIRNRISQHSSEEHDDSKEVLISGFKE